PAPARSPKSCTRCKDRWRRSPPTPRYPMRLSSLRIPCWRAWRGFAACHRHSGERRAPGQPISLVRAQHCQKGFLRYLDATDLLHALLAFLLFLQQFFLTRDVAAVALGQHVLAQRLHRRTRDNLPADRGLDSHIEHLSRDQLAHPLDQFPSAPVGM